MLSKTTRSEQAAHEGVTGSSQVQSGRPWQERLLPLMTTLLVGLAVFFFVTTLVQLAYLHWQISQVPQVEVPTFRPATMGSIDSETVRLQRQQLDVAAAMEAYIVEQRYKQASVQLMSGLWIRYLGFATGMILALVGASFILGKLRESTSEISGTASEFAVSLKSASPGVILVVLGSLLMLATIVRSQEYETRDVPVYLPSLGSQNISTTPQPYKLPPYPTDQVIPQRTPSAETSNP